MKKLFKYVGLYWRTVLLIFIVLFVQAYCDLSLPSYTSDIVNVGIQQNGIDETIPQVIAEEDMQKVLLFVTDTEEKQTVEESYEKDENSYDKKALVLKESVLNEKESQKDLSQILGIPMLLTEGFSSDNETIQQMEEQMKEQLLAAQPQLNIENLDMFQILQMMPAEQVQMLVKEMQKQMSDMPDMIVEQAAVSYVKTAYLNLGMDVDRIQIAEQVQMLVKEMQKQMSDMPDMIVEQAAVSYVKTAYLNLGMDVDRIQIQYILITGGKMIALAFLGMMASVLGGFLASKAAAATGRDLRSKVFRKVVGFSNNEFDHFSTASLITRSTNDIQQIQLLMVMLLRVVLYAPIMAIGGIYKVFHTNVSMSWIIGLAVILIGMVVLTLFAVAMPVVLYAPIMAIGGIYKVFHTNVSMSWIIGLAVILIGMVVLTLFAVAMPKFKVMQKLVDRLNLVTREILTGLPVIRAFSTEKHEEERFDVANRDLTKTNLFVNRAMTFMMPVMMVIMNGISVLIIWAGANGINDGQMQVGDMMAFIQYTMQIIMSFLMICMVSIMLPRAAVAAERVDEVLTSKTLIHDHLYGIHHAAESSGSSRTSR